METDIERRVELALVAILDTDAGIVAITEQESGNVVPWYDDGMARTPCIAYEVGPTDEIGGAGDNRRCRVRCTAFAEGNGARSKTAALIERIELAVTQPALAAQGLDAAPMARRRITVPPDSEASRSLHRRDIELDLWVTK